MFRPTKILAASGVALVLALTGYVCAEETKGTVKSTDATRQEVVLKGTLKNSIYEVDKNASICLDGVKSKLTDIVDGDTATIVYEKKGEHMVAIAIRGLRNAKEATGTVRNVLGDKREVVLKGTVKDSTYELTKDSTVWVGTKKGSLSELREGDSVLITYERKGDHLMAARVIAFRK
jgi:Cu/Ag efflux protein CusF